MKKLVSLLGLTLGVGLALSACSQLSDSNTPSYEQLESITSHGDKIIYNYSAIKNEAAIIAKVQVLDELSAKNSIFMYTDDKIPTMYGFISKREVHVLEYYKNDPGYNSGITMGVLEKAAVDDKYFWHEEGYEPLAKNGIYILFMSNKSATRDWGIISVENGRVSLGKGIDQKGDWDQPEFYEVKVKSLVEFESDLDERTKELILKSDIRYPYEATRFGDSKAFSVLPGAEQKKSSLTISYGEDSEGSGSLVVDIQSIK